MNQKEQITSFIEEYISKFVKKEVELSVGEIRNWPVVDNICANKNPANICHAMLSVKKYNYEFVKGVLESTTYTLKYIK